ncbi:amino acid permease [Lactobacillus curvatus]|nr:amino acid permease [Latilactobacillus curvatus]MSE24021.1 amino acid permease [Latilactobacillus curvatus]
MGLMAKVLRKESLERYLQQDQRLAKTLTAKDLIALGVGAVIGTGIFILPGTIAAVHSGPAITISFMIAAVVCAIAAMCYAEFSSALPVAGSAYSYGNIIFGELVGWLLGWALFLEYMLSVAAVSTGWAAYFVSFIEGFGLQIPRAITGPFDPAHGTYVNLFAMLIVGLIALLLMRGTRSSTRINNIMVLIKLGVVLLFIGVGIFYVKPANWQPFMPFGVSGIFKGASLVFFAYLGFDCVSASAAEVKNPQKNLPIGIIGTLIICTLLYILVAFVLTGMVAYHKLDVANPVTFALQVVHQNWFAGLISLGALAGMFTMMLTMTYSSSRLIYSIGRDGLLPKALGKVTSKHQTPTNSIKLVTIVIMLLGGFVSLNQLTNLVNIGTLVAFLGMSIGVIPLRKRKDIPNKNGFKVPFYPVLPLISGALCLLMMFELPRVTWMAAAIWFVIGLLVYFMYGIFNSRLNND